MKKSRLIVTLMLVALLVTSIAIPAMAATNAGSNMDTQLWFANGNSVACSVDPMTKQNASQWRVSITENLDCVEATYAMLWTLGSDWDWCVGSRTVTRTYGSFNGDYVNASQVIGWDFWAGAMVDVDVVNNIYNIDISWNTDAA